MKTQIQKAWNLDLQRGKNACYALCDAFYSCFFDTLEFTVEKKQANFLGKTVLQVWSQICEKKLAMCPQKVKKKKKIK